MGKLAPGPQAWWLNQRVQLGSVANRVVLPKDLVHVKSEVEEGFL